MLKALKQNAARRKLADQLYASLVAQARRPEFFREFAVPDTLDGRLDLVILHTWMVLERLRELGAGDLAQALTDTVFVGFDEALRQLGAGDVGMGRRMTKISSAFFGRLKAYEGADREEAMAEALLRNLYRGDASKIAQARALAPYISSARAHLAESGPQSRTVSFGPLPGFTR